MTKKKSAYLLMVSAAALSMVYVLFTYFIQDLQATEFLSNKMELKRTLNVGAWLNVMHIHIGFACLGMIAGAINFSASVLKKYRKFHRVNGYLYLIAVLGIVLTSGYMAPYATGGQAVSMAFNILNMLWPAITVTAIVKIRKKQLDAHRRWMVRSYAFVFTNASIHLLTSLLHGGFGLVYTQSYTIAVYSSIVLLLLAAELVNRTIFRNSALIP